MFIFLVDIQSNHINNEKTLLNRSKIQVVSLKKTPQFTRVVKSDAIGGEFTLTYRTRVNDTLIVRGVRMCNDLSMELRNYLRLGKFNCYIWNIT